MDILTLGKMNAMARDVDVTLEYLANATFQALKDTCDVQEGMAAGLEATAQDAVDTIALAGPNKGVQEKHYFNDCARGCFCFQGCSDSFTAPVGTKTIKFEAWGGGGAGPGHCCHQCHCDIASCGSSGGYYTRKTICKDAGEFVGDGSDVYAVCVGDGGNGSGGGCWTACCDAPRGCASYVTGPGLNNYCAVGGRGGYNFYCTCLCNTNHCWYEHTECQGMIVCSPTQCNYNTNVDYASASHGMKFYKEAWASGHCDCLKRWTETGQSENLPNSIMQQIETSSGWCGCETPCRSFRHAGGGMNMMKTYCGNFLCGGCYGSPGRPGLVRITYA